MNYKKQKHIVIIRTSGSVPDLNTYNSQSLGLAQALTRKGFKVSVVFAGHESKKEVLEYSGSEIDVYHVSYFVFKKQQLAWFFGIEKLLVKLSPDYIQVHEFGIVMSWRVVLWAKRKKIPTVLIQGTYQTTQKAGAKQLEEIFNLIFGIYILKNVNGIGCKTNWAAKYLKTYAHVETSLAYVGLNEEMFTNSEEIGWSQRLKLDGKNVLLYVGGLESRRNPFLLVQIIQMLPDNYVLIIVGGGDLYHEVEQKVEELSISHKCLMLGKLKQRELPSLYSCANAFLLPSSYEIFGMVILEAMYFGIPVISSVTAGASTIIEHNIDGILVDDFEVATWVRQIRTLCESPSIYSRIKSQCKQKILDCFLWEKAVNNYIKLYE